LSVEFDQFDVHSRINKGRGRGRGREDRERRSRERRIEWGRTNEFGSVK
jgi:hypothetical protein